MIKDARKHLWDQLKAKVILRYGTLESAAVELDCSVSGLRMAMRGKCPGVLKKLQVAGVLSEEPEEPPASNSLRAVNDGRYVIGAVNDRPISDEEWQQITPWGDFQNPQGLQRITPKQGQDMVAAFNSLLTRAKNGFRGVPVFVGHPDVDPKRYKDERRYGKLEALEARADGLYGKVAWNDLGEQNQQQGYFVYPSGVWKFKRVGSGVIEPFELVSVGLTNTPNIPGVHPWSKNDDSGNGDQTATDRQAEFDLADQLMSKDKSLSFSQACAHARSILEAQDVELTPEMKDQQTVESGFAAHKFIMKKADELQLAGDSEATAILKARAVLPREASIHDKSIKLLAAANAREIDSDVAYDRRITIAHLIMDERPGMAQSEAFRLAKTYETQ